MRPKIRCDEKSWKILRSSYSLLPVGTSHAFMLASPTFAFTWLSAKRQHQHQQYKTSTIHPSWRTISTCRSYSMHACSSSAQFNPWPTVFALVSFLTFFPSLATDSNSLRFCLDAHVFISIHIGWSGLEWNKHISNKAIVNEEIINPRHITSTEHLSGSGWWKACVPSEFLVPTHGLKWIRVE
jgi:hypothetical protein